jgi:Peptidase inhibitor family I36
MRTRKIVVLTSLLMFLVSAAPSTANPRGDGLPPEVATVFPRGLPPGATLEDDDTVSFAGGSILLDVVPGAPTDGVCASGLVCLWEDANYTGLRLTLAVCDVDGDGTCDWVNLGPLLFNDKMTSWKNRKSVDAKWAWDINGGGTVRCMNAGSQNPELADNILGTGDNDEASSVKIFKSATQC